MSGRWVVWTDYRYGGQPDIYAFNLDTKKEFSIATGLPDQHWPDVDGATVIWETNTESHPGPEIRGFNLNTGVSFPVWSAEYGGASQLQLSEGRLVWNQSDEGATLLWCAELGWGMRVEVSGAEVARSSLLPLSLEAATWGTWVTDVRFYVDDRSTPNSWKPYGTTVSFDIGPGDGERRIGAQFRDHEGSLSSIAWDAVTLDETPPVTTEDADAAWHPTAETLHFVANDATSGVSRTEYRLDADATWHTGSSVTVSAPADHSADGVHTVSYRSIDVAGNVEQAKTCQVKIDTRPPVTACNAPSGWVNHAVGVHFVSGDAGAGVDYTEYDLDGGGWTRGGSVLVSGDGVHALSLRSVDLLGHVEATRTFTVRIDTVGPTTEALANAIVRKGRVARRFCATA